MRMEEENGYIREEKREMTLEREFSLFVILRF